MDMDASQYVERAEPTRLPMSRREIMESTEPLPLEQLRELLAVEESLGGKDSAFAVWLDKEIKAAELAELGS